MNICLLPSTFLPLIGGLEIVVHNLASALTKLGHNVYIVTPYPKFRKVIDNYEYKVIRFGFRGCGRLKLTPIAAVLTLLYVVKRYQINVINVHNVYRAGSWSYLFSRFNNTVPIIGTPHGEDVQIAPEINRGRRLNQQSDKIIRRNLNAFDCITAISPSILDDLRGIAREKKIFHVPNGVWIRRFQKKIDSNLIRKKFDIPLNSIAIISIGRNHPTKGFEYGLDAIAKLKKAGYNISYILVGRDMDSIIERAKALSISDVLITPGQVDADAVSALLQASDIYLSPSIAESFGLATLEAMSAGLPCIVTNIAGSRDLVSPKCGFLVKSQNSDQMKESLKSLIIDPSARKEMGQEARKQAARYEWLYVAKQYVKVYNNAVKTPLR